MTVRSADPAVPAEPEPPDVADVEEVLLDGPWRHRFVAANGARFHVAEAGEGPLVLLLHGFPQFWWAWRHQLPALAGAGYHAVAMDLRGYGASDKPPRGYDPMTLTADVAGVVRALGHQDAVIVGHDWGGWLAWSMPALARRVTRAVATIGAPHPLALHEAGRHGAQRRALREVLAFQLPIRPERQLTRGDTVARLLRDWSAVGSPFPDAEALLRYRTAMRVPFVAHCSLEYYRWAIRSLPRSDGRGFTAALRDPLAVPVLQLHGDDDPLMLPDSAAGSSPWAGRRARYELLAGAGHYLPEERPEAVTGLLLNWLAEL